MDLRERPTAAFQRHPWESARAAFFRDVMREHAESSRPLSVLDVGAGDAYLGRIVLAGLPAASTMVCVDAHYDERLLTALAAAAPAGISFVRDPPDRTFDWLLLLDVMEHVPDDRAFLSELVARRLVSGGWALVSVPAWNMLFTTHDVVLGHCRRYAPAALRDVMEAAALEIVAAGQLFPSLFLARAAQKAAEVLRGIHARPPAGEAACHVETDVSTWSGGPQLTSLVGGVLGLDARLSRTFARWHVPLMGLSTWAIGRKR
jgi:hypothetical protein